MTPQTGGPESLNEKFASDVKPERLGCSSLLCVKQETRSFYESLVRNAVERVAHSLDEALHLEDLARSAALSPLHFHRIFRGMVGETPLELHRRLRLERSAWRLAHSDASVSSIAFDAGYETHESFTRSFRDAYSKSPSDFRSWAQADLSGAAAPIALRANCGVHFSASLERELAIAFTHGGAAIDVELENLPERRVAALSHVGAYWAVSDTFRRVISIASAHGLWEDPAAALVMIYHDDPEATAQAELRSEAGILVPANTAIPAELSELRIPAGRYARTTHCGPPNGLADTWTRLMGQWLPNSRQRAAEGVMYDVYQRKQPTAAPDQLRADLYLPIE